MQADDYAMRMAEALSRLNLAGYGVVSTATHRILVRGDKSLHRVCATGDALADVEALGRWLARLVISRTGGADGIGEA